MRKILALSLCLGLVSRLSAQEEKEHTHTIEIKFTVNATPNSTDDWQALEGLFAQFLDTAQNNPDDTNPLPKLLKELKAALEKVPEACEARNMRGNINASTHSYGNVAPELIGVKAQ